MQPSFVGPLFLGIALIFAAAALRDYFRSEGKPTPARKTWIRIALIFAVVGMALSVVHGVLL